jgi:type II secretory pathway component PulC
VSAAAAGSVQTPVVTKVNAAAPRGRKASIPLLVMVNRALAVVVLVLVVFVFYSVASIRPGIAEDLRRQVEGAGSVSVSVATLVSEAVPEVGTYLGRLGSRNLFVPRSAAGGATNVVTEAAVPGKDLMLLGVSVEPSAEAESMAIIKNKADQKTFFVKPGEPVGDTGLTLEKVLADRVILKRQKQAFELK